MSEHVCTVTDGPKAPCGGCIGMGAHRRWCPAVVGPRAARIGQMADDLANFGDTLRPFQADQAWALADRLRRLAEEEAATRPQDDAPVRDSEEAPATPMWCIDCKAPFLNVADTLQDAPCPWCGARSPFVAVRRKHHE